MGLLDGKRVLVTGVLTDASIAFSVARLAQEQGASVVLTGFGRLTLVQRIAKRLPTPAPVVELDVTSPADLAALPDRVREHVDGIDGVLHSIGFAPQSALGGNFLNTEWEDVATAVHVSAYSLKALTVATLPLKPADSGCPWSASTSTPGWRGRSTTGWGSRRRRSSRPRATSRATSGRPACGSTWWPPDRSRRWRPRASPASRNSRTPGRPEHRLGWDVTDPEPAARACIALLSDWFPRTTAEIVHVDGGVHAIGA